MISFDRKILSGNFFSRKSNFSSCKRKRNFIKKYKIVFVPDSKSRNIPEVVFVRRWAVGVLGIWKGWDSWVKGGANGVCLQAA
jgi:hypothetical protein